MKTLRTPAFIIAALVLILIVVLLELGAVEFLNRPRDAAGRISGMVKDAGIEVQPGVVGKMESGTQRKPPGLGIRYLALVDGVLLFTVGLMALSLRVPAKVHALYQGAATAIFAVILLVLSIGLIVLAIAKLTLMIALLLAIPFGTIIYLVVYGFFNVGGAALVLGLLMTLKIASGACLLIAHALQKSVPKTGLVLLVLTSLVAGVIVTFLHSLVPGILASITDAIAAIVVGVIAVVWLIALLISSIPAIIAAVQATGASATSKVIP